MTMMYFMLTNKNEHACKVTNGKAPALNKSGVDQMKANRDVAQAASPCTGEKKIQVQKHSHQTTEPIKQI